MKTSATLLAGLAWAVASTASAAPHKTCGPLTTRDIALIKADILAYRDRWLAGDAAAVMRTFTAEPVLMPPQSAPAVVGRAAVERFWWPPGPPTPITRLEITFEEIGGDCRMAYARGLDEVEWTVDTPSGPSTRRNAGTYLNVMRKQPDGEWRISHHMWDDDPARRR